MPAPSAQPAYRHRVATLDDFSAIVAIYASLDGIGRDPLIPGKRVSQG